MAEFCVIRSVQVVAIFPCPPTGGILCILIIYPLSMDIFYPRGENNDECPSDSAALTPEDETILHTISNLLGIEYNSLVQVNFL